MKVHNFVNEYLSQFGSAVLNVPFSRESREAGEFMYDMNSLEVEWQQESSSNNRVMLYGVKSSIEEFVKKVEMGVGCLKFD